jgi:alkylresorcinol/alkylpyrone synthase
MEALYTNIGIETRYSCVPAYWSETPHRWEERTATYQRHALDLLQRVSAEAIAEAGLLLADIDFLVLDTVTGLAIPSLDCESRLAARPDIERLPIFGRGCGGGVAGLRRAYWHMRAGAPTFCC